MKNYLVKEQPCKIQICQPENSKASKPFSAKVPASKSNPSIQES